MKIRIQGNSLRYRLSRTEVEKLSKEGLVTENTSFGNTVFSYSVECSADIDKLSATFENNRITVFLPSAFTLDWPENSVVGIEGHMPVGSAGSLYLLIEKDFKCLDRPTEDQSDQYENPKQNC